MPHISKSPWMMTATRSAQDWAAIRETIDVPSALSRLLGPPPGRRGGRGRLWWTCPLGTHDDRNPSFTLPPGSTYWKCYGCGESGDLINLVRRLNPFLTFPEAVAFVAGAPAPGRRSEIRRPPGTANSDPPSEASGLSLADAHRLVTEAEVALWVPAGAETLAYLHGRGLHDETIRARRLGFTAGVSYPTKSGGTARASGVVIPWFDGDRLALVKVRQHDREPRYAEVHRTPAHLTCYPGPAAIQPGLPLVAVEGELDAALLGQELAGLANVVTLGSASSKPTGRALAAFLRCPRWYAAHDNDAAGNRAAEQWPARAVRVRPPGQFKDWTELVQAPHPVNLRRWWSDVLSGNRQPSLYSWDELKNWRWGGADDSPGLEV